MKNIKLTAENDGHVTREEITFDAQRGTKIKIYMDDFSAFVQIDGVSEPIEVCKGLPIWIRISEMP